MDENPLLKDWSTKWSSELGRDIPSGAFKPDTLPKYPAIIVR
jgi:hypothetical protein